MIVDSLKNWDLYFTGEPWNFIFNYISTLSDETPDGDYPIMGNQIYARVMSYETKAWNELLFESHRSYIDIQTVLSCAEGIAWCHIENLNSFESYNSKNDVEYYFTPQTCHTRVDVFPGTFVVLYPDDAHMPQLKVDGVNSNIKKVVIKLHSRLIENILAK